MVKRRSKSKVSSSSELEEAMVVLVVVSILSALIFLGYKVMTGGTKVMTGGTKVMTGGTKVMKTYRVAPTADGIKNRNTGNIKGDNSYISGEFCARHSDCGKSKITEYTVSLPDDYEFGQYALCNPGGEVGKIGHYQCSGCNEQCKNDICEFQGIPCKHKADCNKDVTRCTPNPGREDDRFAGGSWYSWPEGSQCKSLSDLKDKKCKWFVHDNTKSISVNELQSKGYRMMTNEKCADKCTSKEIANFVKEHEEQNLNILNNWANK